MRTVYICFPLDLKDYESSVSQGKKYQNYAVSCGMVPVAPALMFEEYYNDVRPERKVFADLMSDELLKTCSEIWVCGDSITKENQRTIILAKECNHPILYVPDSYLDGDIKIRQDNEPFSKGDCVPDSNHTNYENRILVLNPSVIMSSHRTADNSLWKAYNGFGCTYGARGQAVFATNLLTGEKARWERSDFLGVVEPHRLLEWMWDKPIRDEIASEAIIQAKKEVSAAQTDKFVDIGDTDIGYPYLIGYVQGEKGWESTLLIPTAENIASYIVSHGLLKDLQITTPMDQPFITTYGQFIDKCADQGFLQKKLLPVLVPMQQGDIEPKPILEFEEQADYDSECGEEQEENEDLEL